MFGQGVDDALKTELNQSHSYLRQVGDATEKRGAILPHLKSSTSVANSKATDGQMIKSNDRTLRVRTQHRPPWQPRRSS